MSLCASGERRGSETIPTASRASCAWPCSWTLARKNKEAAQHLAVSRFVNDIQEALSCVTTERLSFAAYHPGKTHFIWLADENEPVQLKGRFRLTMAIALKYSVVAHEKAEGGWKVRTAKYIYEITDSQGGPLFDFHWHPDGESRVTTPHMHIRPSIKVAAEIVDLYRAVTKAHIPTGRISLEDVLRFLVDELDVEPLRADWETVLSGTDERYRLWRSWS